VPRLPEQITIFGSPPPGMPEGSIKKDRRDSVDKRARSSPRDQRKQRWKKSKAAGLTCAAGVLLKILAHTLQKLAHRRNWSTSRGRRLSDILD